MSWKKLLMSFILHNIIVQNTCLFKVPAAAKALAFESLYVPLMMASSMSWRFFNSSSPSAWKHKTGRKRVRCNVILRGTVQEETKLKTKTIIQLTGTRSLFTSSMARFNLSLARFSVSSTDIKT